MSLGSLFLSELDAGPPSRAQAPLRTCTRHRAPSFDSCTPSSCSTTCLDNPTEPSDLSSTTKITTLNHLRSLVPHSYCIGIDVEGIEGIAQGITSVGISILPPVFSLSPASADGSWPWPFPDHHQGQIDLDTIASHYRLQSYCFAVLGRERARSYEHFHYGEVVHHPITHLQSTIVSVLQSIRLQDPTAHTILVGFDMELEHRAVKSVFPLLDDHVTHWCDVSHTGLADARWEGRRVAHKTHRKISLRDAMLALNFRRNHGIQPRARHHSAGMDAVRTLGTMLALLARAPEAGGLVVKRFTWEEHGNRKLWEWVPRPASKFPWTVKIVPVPTDDKDGTAHLPESLGRPARLFNFVTRNFAEPKAVAVCPPARSGPLKTHGWVSLHNEEEMKRLVRDWDGKMVVDGVMLKVGGRPPPENPPKTSLEHPMKASSSINEMVKRAKSMADELHVEEEEAERDSFLAEGLSNMELDDTGEVASALDFLFQSDSDDSSLGDICRTYSPIETDWNKNKTSWR
ncbi:hypothetical protein NCU17057 [Neurospora crassa OR74A]|uniref:Uncharacterized protein n=1 Tax=Neurospora crassa (strain ATCC 24698 / 74-OR23-1A / CBS 708.71 / DSM 1257 / FGSC 987) TaxID=367110 RepID=V5IKK1_NEUCR|nr:hypothetical protein NCU17057 [Neurospora crassa OR74A]ESA42088.1 hypothetical protein NCU17057 [Neurospora crassa OR74A]|eukprot:XP_011395072.1 hypothetical protein NCU17057 [Neurospora crassa OR74A]